ncbi:lactococcin 972 family bacteriocin [Streptomyces erythrochromogenes]|uniref:lactococcin 972 family bacteriocin n=1 Tax=Streptomyces erythrochromogenes TaxID=285574 RepID=UPI000300016B
MQISTKIKAAVVAAGFVLAASVPAVAATSQVSGGTWMYGTNSSDMVYSNYYHPTRCHGSSAQGKYLAQSGNVDKDRTSYASAPEAWSGNKSYYRSNCE